MTDIETKARAAFEWLHAKDSRVRNWDHHPEEDNGAELGRNTFRGMMAAAVAAEAPPEEPEYTGGPVEPVAAAPPLTRTTTGDPMVLSTTPASANDEAPGPGAA